MSLCRCDVVLDRDCEYCWQQRTPMKEYKSIEKSEYSSLQQAKVKLQAQTQELLILQQKYRELEKRHYELLINSPAKAEKLVELGDYVSVDSHF